MLLDKTPIGAGQAAQPGLRHAGQIHQVIGFAGKVAAHLVMHRTLIAVQTCGQQAQQGGLAGAGFTHDRQHLSRIEVKTHIATGPAGLALMNVGLAGAAGRQQYTRLHAASCFTTCWLPT